MEYIKPKIIEITTPATRCCRICNSEAFSCYLSVDERNDFLRNKHQKKKLVFFHGFASSSRSSKVAMLEELLTDYVIIAPDIPIDPEEALPFLKALCKKEQPDFVVGKCMGGMYCQQMYGFKRICINPEFYMSKHTLVKTGTYVYYNERMNGDKSFTVTQEMITHFEQMEKHQFDGITEKDLESLWILNVGLNSQLDSTNPIWKQFHNIGWYPGSPRIDRHFLASVLIPIIRQAESTKIKTDI